MNLFRQTPQVLLGLDIQSSRVKAVALRQQGEDWKIERIMQGALPNALFEGEKIRQWSLLTEALTVWLRAQNLEKTVAAVTLPSSLVSLEQLTLPVGLSVAEIESAISETVQQQVPGIGKLAIDYSSTPLPDPRYQQIAFAATRQDYVTHYHQALEAAGLNVKYIDIDIHALARAVQFVLRRHSLSYQTLAIIKRLGGLTLFLVVHQTAIIFQQAWQRDKDEWLHIKNKIHLYQLSFAKTPLESLIFCEPQPLVALKAVAADGNLTLHHLKPFPNPDTVSSAEDFWIAYGCAMRRVEEW